MMNFFFGMLVGMLVMYLISGFCYMWEDFSSASKGWHTPLPDIFYTPITTVLDIIQDVFIILRHPVIVIKYFINKYFKKKLDKN